MEIDARVLAVIIGGMMVTWLSRVLPFAVFNKFEMPRVFLRFLRYVPLAVMTTLLTQEVLMPSGTIQVNPRLNPGLIAIVPTLLVAWKTKSLIGTVLTGVIAMALCTHIF